MEFLNRLILILKFPFLFVYSIFSDDLSSDYSTEKAKPSPETIEALNDITKGKPLPIFVHITNPEYRKHEYDENGQILKQWLSIEAQIEFDMNGKYTIHCESPQAEATFNRKYSDSFYQPTGGCTPDGIMYDGKMVVFPENGYTVFLSLYYGNSTATLDRPSCKEQVATYESTYLRKRF